MYSPRFALLAVLSLAACREADGSQETRLRPAPVAPSANAPKVIDDVGPHPADDRVNPAELAERDAKKGDRSDPEWVPKEFAGNLARWKDSGVYVDGKPVGFLTWGELPIGCKVSWLRDKVSAEKRYGTNDPGWKWARKRYYKFTDYLAAIGVDVRKVKELHVYAAKPTQTLIVTGRQLQSPAASEFWFWFGANTSGKPIPHAPDGFGNGRVGDKITSVMVYIDKKPPTLVENEGLFLDGVEQTGVPYYGEPIRGGVRVYLDDRLATIIKRQELDPKQAKTVADGEPQWRLVDLLTAHGVDTRKVVEMWTIRGEKRSEKFSAAELATMTFQASSQSKGGVLVGDNRVLANVIALHTRALKPSDLPIPEQDDE
ncbi:MAG TPA: hypothetical protein VFT22_35430 [Kofleriaceae bacterium]|nr:hypothetical protein [Kofleriaceae bacterium]